MEISGQVWSVITFFASWVISVIAHNMLMYRALLNTRPDVTVEQVAWSRGLFLRREKFTVIGWRYRQAAMACLAIPMFTALVAAALWWS
jgi:hypothetical protein